MDRRLCLHVLTTVMACTLLPSAAFAAALHPVAAPLPPLPDHENLVSSGQEDAPDPLYTRAVAVVMINQNASIALVQRHLKLGYNRAARLLESMEQAGLIGSQYVNGYRQILTHH